MIDFLKALPFWGLVLFFTYEAIAVQTHIVPSISFAIHGQLENAPLAFITVSSFLAGVLWILLILHLTGSLSWWKP